LATASDSNLCSRPLLGDKGSPDAALYVLAPPVLSRARGVLTRRLAIDLKPIRRSRALEQSDATGAPRQLRVPLAEAPLLGDASVTLAAVALRGYRGLERLAAQLARSLFLRLASCGVVAVPVLLTRCPGGGAGARLAPRAQPRGDTLVRPILSERLPFPALGAALGVPVNPLGTGPYSHRRPPFSALLAGPCEKCSSQAASPTVRERGGSVPPPPPAVVG
jgi:hypothetical protein